MRFYRTFALGISALTLLTVGCGGSKSVSDNTGQPGNSSTGSNGFQVSGRVTANGSGVGGMPVVLTSATSVTPGYVQVTTSGDGSFAAQVPWPDVTIAASSEQYIGATQVSYAGNARPSIAPRSSNGSSVFVESMSDFAVVNPPTDFPPSDFTNNALKAQPRFFPLLIAELVVLLEDITTVGVSAHFVQDFLERDVTVGEVTETMANGEAFYDPKYDTIVRWKDGIALSLTQGEDKLISVIKGMDKPTTRWIPIDGSHARRRASIGLHNSRLVFPRHGAIIGRISYVPVVLRA